MPDREGRDDLPAPTGGAVRVNPNEVERDFLGLTKAA